MKFNLNPTQADPSLIQTRLDTTREIELRLNLQKIHKFLKIMLQSSESSGSCWWRTSTNHPVSLNVLSEAAEFPVIAKW
jgi:hypothetical protein